MRDVLYSVAMSLDGFIAGPSGEYDWIPQEPQIEWETFMGRFDTVLIGRKSYETLLETGTTLEGMELVVFSRNREWVAAAERSANVAGAGTRTPPANPPEAERRVDANQADTPPRRLEEAHRIDIGPIRLQRCGPGGRAAPKAIRQDGLALWRRRALP